MSTQLTNLESTSTQEVTYAHPFQQRRSRPDPRNHAVASPERHPAGDNIRHAQVWAIQAGLRGRADRADHRGRAPAPNPKSAFSRIIPMIPEPATAPASNPKSAFSRICSVIPEPTVPFESSRTDPLNREPPVAFESPRIGPVSLEPAVPFESFRTDPLNREPPVAFGSPRIEPVIPEPTVPFEPSRTDPLNREPPVALHSPRIGSVSPEPTVPFESFRIGNSLGHRLDGAIDRTRPSTS